MKSVQDYVTEVVTNEGALDAPVNPYDTFDDLGLDSLDMMRILSLVEANYDNISLGYNNTIQANSIHGLAGIVEEQLDRNEAFKKQQEEN